MQGERFVEYLIDWICRISWHLCLIATCLAKLLSWEIDGEPMCSSSSSSWQESRDWLNVAIIGVHGLGGGTSLIEELV